jgi:hypothetical protein
VGRVGALLDDVVRPVHTIHIPQDLVGWEFRAGRALEEGIAHASLALQPAIETRSLTHCAEDDNGVKHPAIWALHDWFFGSDDQWLIASAQENRYHSHDHGHYFPGGPGWQEAGLLAVVDNPSELAEACVGLRRERAEEIVERLAKVTRDDLISALTRIPASWPITDEELECVGFFLETRAPQVSDRLAQRLRR